MAAAADPDANIIFGAVIDDTIPEQQVRVTVIATGFDQIKKKTTELEDFEIRPFTSENLDIPAFLRRRS